MALIEHSRDGIILSVKAKPNARREGILGIVTEQLVVAVRTPPERGKANEAIVEILSEWLDIPKRSLEIRSGSSSRDKRVSVRGIDENALRARIEDGLRG
jgi:uncharacterized protein (TIGR00251 family)